LQQHGLGETSHRFWKLYDYHGSFGAKLVNLQGQAMCADVFQRGLAEAQMAITQHTPGNPKAAPVPFRLAPFRRFGWGGGHRYAHRL
jgi:hypothetical protein